MAYGQAMPPAATVTEAPSADECTSPIENLMDEVLHESSSDDLRVMAKEVLERVDADHWQDVFLGMVIQGLRHRMVVLRSDLRAEMQGDTRSHRRTTNRQREVRSWRTGAAPLYLAVLTAREAIGCKEYRALGH